MSVLKGMTLPVKYDGGKIVDGSGKTIIKAEREGSETPLPPTGRDALLQVLVILINEAFEYDRVDRLLKKLGY